MEIPGLTILLIILFMYTTFQHHTYLESPLSSSVTHIFPLSHTLFVNSILQAKSSVLINDIMHCSPSAMRYSDNRTTWMAARQIYKQMPSVEKIPEAEFLPQLLKILLTELLCFWLEFFSKKTS